MTQRRWKARLQRSYRNWFTKTGKAGAPPKLAPLPEVMDHMKSDLPDLSENDLALTAAMLLVSADWEERGLLPASFVDMRGDVESLTAQYGYPKQEDS